MARARKVQKKVKKEPLKRTKKKTIRKPKLITRKTKQLKQKPQKRKEVTSKPKTTYPRTFYTLKEDSVIITRLQKRQKRESIHKLTKELGHQLSRSYESVRDRIRRYLTKLDKKDQKLILEVAKQDPGSHLTFEHDKKGNKIITKVQKHMNKKGEGYKSVSIVKTKDDLEWLKKNLNSKDFYFAADHGSQLLGCILLELQNEHNIPKDKIESFVKNLNEHVDLEEVFRFFSIQLIQYFYQMSQLILKNIEQQDLVRYKQELNKLKDEFNSQQFQDKYKLKQTIIFLTSGGTAVYIDKQKSYMIDNFSTGSRGSKLATYFLQEGYCVIFLSRINSKKPFYKEFNLDQIEQQKQYNQFCQKYIDQIIHIQFQELFEYLYKLQDIISFLKENQIFSISILAAAVSDFYLPLSQLQDQKKLQNINLQNTPKIIFDLHNKYQKIITFKLETDENILEKKILESFKKYNSDLIIGNILQTRYELVYLFDKQNKSINKIYKQKQFDIEYTIVKKIIDIFKQQILNQYLSSIT